MHVDNTTPVDTLETQDAKYIDLIYLDTFVPAQ